MQKSATKQHGWEQVCRADRRYVPSPGCWNISTVCRHSACPAAGSSEMSGKKLWGRSWSWCWCWSWSWSGLVGGASGRAAACLEIPCSLMKPPGRHQSAPHSLGWAQNSGVWVLKGDARTHILPRNIDDVGVVWESRSGYETAWATPGHVCSCSYSYGRGPVLPQVDPSVFTEAVNLWSRVASFLTPWCAKEEVPTGVNLNRYSGDGSCIPWHCDNERLFGSPFEPKVIVSMRILPLKFGWIMVTTWSWMV